MNSQNNEKQSIVKKIMQNEKVIMLCLAISPFLYAGLNAIYNIAYKFECEKFYGVPRKYFASSVDDRILYTFCIIFVLMLGVVPIAIKKYNVKNNSSKKECLLETAILSI